MTTESQSLSAPATSDDGVAFVPWTICLPHDGGFACADLEHHAPLPRIGDAVEYIDEAGKRHWYRVREVVHTVQSAADTRPTVAEGDGPPNTIPRDAGPAEAPASSGQVRAGLPRVYVHPTDPPQLGDMMSDNEQRPDAGAYIGRKPEFATETIPGGIGPDDERVAAGDTQSSGTGSAEERSQGRKDELPGGHREGPQAGDDDVREAGKNR